MGKITVTADAGVRAKVTVQKLEKVSREIQAVTDSMGRIVAPAHKEEFSVFVDAAVFTFASEAREFEIGPDQRLFVEEQA